MNRDEESSGAVLWAPGGLLFKMMAAGFAVSFAAILELSGRELRGNAASTFFWFELSLVCSGAFFPLSVGPSGMTARWPDWVRTILCAATFLSIYSGSEKLLISVDSNAPWIIRPALCLVLIAMFILRRQAAAQALEQPK